MFQRCQPQFLVLFLRCPNSFSLFSLLKCLFHCNSCCSFLLGTWTAEKLITNNFLIYFIAALRETNALCTGEKIHRKWKKLNYKKTKNKRTENCSRFFTKIKMNKRKKIFFFVRFGTTHTARMTYTHTMISCLRRVTIDSLMPRERDTKSYESQACAHRVVRFDSFLFSSLYFLTRNESYLYLCLTFWQKLQLRAKSNGLFGWIRNFIVATRVVYVLTTESFGD